MADGNPPNLLYYGDNLDILRRYVKDESVDLIYLDPPFKSNQDYNVLFKERNGTQSAAQIRAFEDTWQWDEAAALAYKEIVEAGGKVSQAMQAFHTYLGPNDMLAYLAMMAPRLVELRRVLRPAGSIYLHCDPTASHYLKILMDAILGPGRFQNEIIWSYRRWPSPTNHFQRMHDSILFYAKSPDGPATFHVEYEPNSPSYAKRFKGKTQMLDPVSKTRKITLERDSKGLPRRDVWDISIIAGFGKERMGYPTQKPETLLKRIIETSSKPGELVLDPFGGCGTAVIAAQRLGRRWISIDITHLAITLMKKRLFDTFGKDAQFQVIGEPTDVAGAEALAKQDPYQFQWWALGLVDARPAEGKKGADNGIDGRIYFHDEAGSGETKQVILSVKAGHTGAAHVHELRGVVEREKAAIGVLISLQEPTGPMRTDAAEAGFYHSPGWNQDYPRIQLRTIAELLAGKGIDAPPQHVTFKRAPKHVHNGHAQLELTGATSDAEPYAVSDGPNRSPARKRKA